MAKKKTAHHARKAQNNPEATTENKPVNSLKDMLNDDMLSKLKSIEKDLKNAKEQEAREEAERRQREKEEREKNKSFAELLEEYDKKSGGKFA
ncbi:DUF3886 domain-containing protein [Brevibacillus ginsengisoli]|uniref:DUF3886 domain-containing protein n=1 Tax=Brevibacillus ginsengisoli TaxID=363854 RepID=UPI003CEAE168